MDTLKMTSADDERVLRDALETVETCLETPVVSGELEGWTLALQESWQELIPVVIQRNHGTHRAQLKQIGNQDPELLPRVKQLDEEDQQIGCQLLALTERIGRLTAIAESVEPNEGRAENERSKLIAEGIAFIVRVRTQEVSLRTWFAEAFNRDCGVGD